ncbi:MAG: tRNA glutamyl-Q(34) synthetase GluQRS [Gammaproteobacteria bacterium]|nr:tRNA glutamyl-Q(34) synthetase GluQRS [Gammaproteobacteria bacterium]MCP5137204.1 tRNA glutamyl-Q(34) synthetase GluQRS [Gammaproteobacteria bacterium]
MPYIGRFAPSPTGLLHFGSLIAAVGSYLQARSQNGRWLLRMEDIDPPRAQPGAADAIIATLRAYGFEWDGPIRYQSTRGAAYDAALDRLRADGWLFPCSCSRREITEAGGVYPGTCRNGPPDMVEAARPMALRVRSDGPRIHFHDALQGDFDVDVAATVGDFVLKRADGLFAYQLAVVVDDAEQGVTEVVRGSDLLDSTARQIHLQRLLGYRTPDYVHLPVVIDQDGYKLSKQTYAAPLRDDDPIPALCAAMAFLGQAVPEEMAFAALGDFWAWAIRNWRLVDVPRRLSAPGIAFNGLRDAVPPLS